MFVEEDELERDKQLLDLCTSVLEAEEERLKGQPTMSISETRKALDKRIDILRLKGLQKWLQLLILYIIVIYIDRKEKN
mgnify:FL=1